MPKKKTNLFNEINSLLKKFLHDEIAKDNLVFKFHRVYTVILLMTFSIVTQLTQVRIAGTLILMDKHIF